MPGVLLNPVGLKKPQALVFRSFQIGEEDRFEGRWKLLMLMDGEGRGERVVGVCACACVRARACWGESLYPEDIGAGGIPGSLSGIFYPSRPLGPDSQVKSNNFGLQLLPACHVPTQSFFEIWSCS